MKIKTTPTFYKIILPLVFIGLFFFPIPIPIPQCNSYGVDCVENGAVFWTSLSEQIKLNLYGLF
jgi:hypothetical protein